MKNLLFVLLLLSANCSDTIEYIEVEPLTTTIHTQKTADFSEVKTLISP